MLYGTSYQHEFETRGGIDRTRYIYEPRVLWSLESIPTTGTIGGSSALTRRTVDPGNLRNGSRWPIRLTHMLVAGAGYNFRSLEIAAAPTTNAQYDNSMGIINKMAFLLSHPRTMHVMHFDMATISNQAQPTSMPSPTSTQNITVGADDNGLFHASSLFGVSRWDFDIPYDLPRKGAVQFDLSVVPNTNASAAASGSPPVTSVMFSQESDQFNQTGRLRPRAANDFVRGVGVGDGLFPAGLNAAPYDGFGTGAYAGTMTPQFWRANQRFQPDDFRAQESNRGSAVRGLKGFAVAVDQVDFDDVVAASVNQPIAMFANRMATQCRTTSGGTGEWWWQPGAPLALVCPTITPALVVKLSDPIWLGPGDALECEIQAPIGVSIGGNSLTPTYNLGISFAGYAVVEM